MLRPESFLSFFFFNDTATTEIYTLSLHDALPISLDVSGSRSTFDARCAAVSSRSRAAGAAAERRSEEHTSELQSRLHLVCRLLLEKKKENRQNFVAGQRNFHPNGLKHHLGVDGIR